MEGVRHFVQYCAMCRAIGQRLAPQHSKFRLPFLHIGDTELSLNFNGVT
jgi:hypothetical protein